MNKKRNKASGFTLLEVIIVIIIIGILASLALPRFFKTVTYSTAAEALTNLSALRQSLIRCGAQTSPPQSYGLCLDTAGGFADLDIEDPNLVAGRRFNYTPLSAAVGAFQIQADSLNAPGVDVITMTDTGIKAGTGAFTGIK